MYKIDSPKKKPWYKRWKVWGYTFGALIVIGMFVPEPPEVEPEVAAVVKAPEKVEVVAAAKSPEEIAAEAEVAALFAEMEKADEAKAEEKAKADAKTKAAADAEAKVAAKAKKASDAKSKAAADSAVRESLQGIIALSDGVVTDIKPSPYGNGSWETVWVIVSDAWYNSEEHEKERFAESVGGAVKLATNGDAMLVHFYDEYDKVLAKEKVFGGYDIKR